MTDELKIEFPTQGWRQMLTARKNMLDAYDSAREQSRSHEVETFHGNVAEAVCRQWLSSFLPKRYGVTSGYIVSPGLGSEVKTPHFDILIYDQLEAPVLWIEDSPDASSQGRSLAIPVEYVQAVLEVKSAFSSRTVREATGHLQVLMPLMESVDDPDERYKVYLPLTFSCGLIFFELREEQFFNYAALSAVIDGFPLRGFFGGVILRFEGSTVEHTGRISLLKSDTPVKGFPNDGRIPLPEAGRSDSIEFGEELHIGAELSWSEWGFSQFAFDIIAMMQGNYRRGQLSSAYGMGSWWWELIQSTRNGEP